MQIINITDQQQFPRIGPIGGVRHNIIMDITMTLKFQKFQSKIHNTKVKYITSENHKFPVELIYDENFPSVIYFRNTRLVD